MPKTILNFNIESTNETLTPRTGVAILGEYLKGMTHQFLKKVLLILFFEKVLLNVN